MLIWFIPIRSSGVVPREFTMEVLEMPFQLTRQFDDPAETPSIQGKV
jgi:hypothetical protein